MKRLAAYSASLLFGVTIGLLVGHAHATREMKETDQEALKTMESSAGVEAARDARAIGLIQAGETEKAVHLLCTPIANYYYTYDVNTGYDKYWAEYRAIIESLVSSNATVAAEMANHKQVYQQKSE